MVGVPFPCARSPADGSPPDPVPRERGALAITATKSASADAGPSRLREISRLSVSAVLEALDATLGGLSSEDATRRLHEYGRNELSHAQQMGFARDILQRCRSPLVIQLLVIATVTSDMPVRGGPRGTIGR
jgi:Mg2+-importing ATPase